jgi:hypothetical protein
MLESPKPIPINPGITSAQCRILKADVLKKCRTPAGSKISNWLIARTMGLRPVEDQSTVEVFSSRGTTIATKNGVTYKDNSRSRATARDWEEPVVSSGECAPGAAKVIASYVESSSESPAFTPNSSKSTSKSSSWRSSGLRGRRGCGARLAWAPKEGADGAVSSSSSWTKPLPSTTMTMAIYGVRPPALSRVRR